eukprot:TRINITY_DN2789_c0_g1_i3.p1 TRINITY_DN2789_c0_g1~~TRINITY_DN2789_c0_g1_i3.p1  ORF type:complete len:591 (-),score=93.84 TRINITY_DN2789_c0_g1_i3:29-1801(-)
MAKIRRAVSIYPTLSPKMKIGFDRIMEIYDSAFVMRLYVHKVLFKETIWAQGTKEQFNKYQDAIDKTEIIGCFAMTELGHSSFLRGIETTATYDRQTREFVIHTTTLTGTKWWIGFAGQTATHTTALCQLIIGDKLLGLHWFIVPLRNRDGSFKPGVTCGSVGAKAGRHGLDNGWIQFSNVRVPRENMLMRWSQVSIDGEYTALPNQSLSYSTLLGERILALGGVSLQLSSAITTSVRYAAVRRQGRNNQQILDYQTHQTSLMPIIASIFAIQITGRKLMSDWTQVLSSTIESSEKESFLTEISEYHSISAGLKAWCGWFGAESLEIIRRSMGGHAYSQYNAIHGIISDYGVLTTGGGDNIVLAQQCAAHLVKSMRSAMEGKRVTGFVDYFSDFESILAGSRWDGSEASRPEVIIGAFRWLSVSMVSRCVERLSRDLSSGYSFEDAWNTNQTELVESTRPHCCYFVLKTFLDSLKGSDPSLVPILRKLWFLYALTNVKQLIDRFLEFEYFRSECVPMVRKLFVDLCATIRTDAVPLVDAFNLPDWVIKAPLGRFDGDIYTKYFETVNRAPHAIGTPYWDKEIAPLLKSNL